MSSASLPIKQPTNSGVSSNAMTGDKSLASVHSDPGAPNFFRRVCSVLSRDIPLLKAAAVTSDEEDAPENKRPTRGRDESAVNVVDEGRSQDAAKSKGPDFIMAIYGRREGQDGVGRF